MTNLDVKLQKTPIDAATRADIINGLWPRKPSLRLHQDDLDWNAYFAYYTRQSVQWNHASARTHQDVIDTARLLEQLASRGSIKDVLKANSGSLKPAEDDDEPHEGSINLTARLLLMLDIGVLQNAFSGRTPLIWKDESLKDFVHEYFSDPPVLDCTGVKFEKVFTAYNLERIGGMEIEWTDNLADHLRITSNDDKKIAIFHHASFLQWQHR
jgi:hypothetical protein